MTFCCNWGSISFASYESRMSNTINSTGLLEPQGSNSKSLGFSRTTGIVTTGFGGTTFAISRSLSATVKMADNVDLSETAKAFPGDLESGNLPDLGPGQSGAYKSLGASRSRKIERAHGMARAMRCRRNVLAGIRS